MSQPQFKAGDYLELISVELKKQDLIWKHQEIVRVRNIDERDFYGLELWNADAAKKSFDYRPPELVERCYRKISEAIARQRRPELFNA